MTKLMETENQVVELKHSIIGFKFYAGGVVHLELPNSSLQHGTDEVHELLVGPVRTARVENFDKCDTFVVKGKVDSRVGVWVYIHATPAEVKRHLIKFKTDETNYFADVFTFALRFRGRFDREWQTELQVWKDTVSEKTDFGKRVEGVGRFLILDGLDEMVERSMVAKLLKLYDLQRKAPTRYYVNMEPGEAEVDASTAFALVEAGAGHRDSQGTTPEKTVFSVVKRFREEFTNWRDLVKSSNYKEWRA